MKKEYDILIIDDEPVVTEAVSMICVSEGYSVDKTLTSKEGLTKALSGKHKIIICDIMMPDLDGFGIMEKVRQMNVNSPFIMSTGYSTVENTVKSLYMGAFDYLPKPFTSDELLALINRSVNFIDLPDEKKQHPRLPGGYLMLGGLSWLNISPEGIATVGLMELYLSTLNKITEIKLMNPSEDIIQGGSLIKLRNGGFCNESLSPVSGKIVQVNESLKEDFNLINSAPYTDGWIYKVLPENFEYESRYLL